MDMEQVVVEAEAARKARSAVESIKRKLLAHDLATLSRRLRDVSNTMALMAECTAPETPLMATAIRSRVALLDGIQADVLEMHKDLCRDGL